jgi:hypothetical protein
VLKNEYGVEHSTELTSAQASNLIERLKEFEAKIPKEAPLRRTGRRCLRHEP